MRDRSASTRVLAAALGGLFLALLIGACADKPRTLSVIYYYKAGEPGLQERMASVSALEKEFPGRITTRAIAASTSEAQRDLEHLEIGTSGIVVRNSNSVLVFKQGETTFDIGRVRDAIRGGLGLPAAQ